MAKLKTREIIILAIAALLVVSYAGYYFVNRSASEKAKISTSVDSVKINTSNTIKNDLINDKPDDVKKYVIKRLETDWEKNPFWKKDSYREWANREGTANGVSAKIIYSGYVISGKNKMAVINGVEYRIGEQLEIEGNILKEITPSKVLIFNKNTGNKLEIPLEE
jgi:hypothetical protein